MSLVAKIYRLASRTIGRVASFARILSVRLKYPRSRINFGCHLSRGCDIVCSDGSELVLRDVYVSPNTTIKADGGRISISRTFIGQGCSIVSLEEIAIGDGCEIAEMVVIRDQDHQFGTSAPVNRSGFSTAPIRIDGNVWIGCKATILKNVYIRPHSVIAAHALVRECVVDERSLWAGTPAVKKRSFPA
jgi:acetyltransferase-like isoleucine patch superfamily enzyme